MKMRPQRLFIALPFPDPVKAALNETVADLKAQGVTGNYSRPENYHITLVFVGETTQGKEIIEAVKEVSFTPFSVELDGGGHFRDLYWVGLKPSEELNEYVRRLRMALDRAGISYDRKGFKPHVTVLRRAVPLKEGAAISLSVSKASMEVTHISVMRSERIHGVLTYPEVGGADAVR